MSFILDALKKSENERQEQGTAEFASVPSRSETPRAPKWLWILALLLAINVVVLLGLFMRDDTQVAMRTAAETPPVEAPAATVAAPSNESPADAEPTFAEQLEVARAEQPVVVARAEPAATEQPPLPVAPARSEFTLSALPTAAELRANGTIQMAELHLDIHVFSESPDDRFVFINMARHKEGSQLAEGPVVSEITPEGVILDYLGTRFLLPRE